MLSVLLIWVLIGLVTASIGSRILDATGAALLGDLVVGAGGAAGGGILLVCLKMSIEDALHPLGLAASLVGALGALAARHARVTARRKAEPQVKPPAA